MTQTGQKIGQPAWSGTYGLTVDNMARPSLYIILSLKGEAGDAFSEIARLPYDADADRVVQPIAAEGGMSIAKARLLINQVAMKLASPKAVDAEGGARPIR